MSETQEPEKVCLFIKKKRNIKLRNKTDDNEEESSKKLKPNDDGATSSKNDQDDDSDVDVSESLHEIKSKLKKKTLI